jgi:hypothetical protein
LVTKVLCIVTKVSDIPTLEFILNQTGSSVVICGGNELEKVRKYHHDYLPIEVYEMCEPYSKSDSVF